MATGSANLSHKEKSRSSPERKRIPSTASKTKSNDTFLVPEKVSSRRKRSAPKSDIVSPKKLRDCPQGRSGLKEFSTLLSNKNSNGHGSSSPHPSKIPPPKQRLQLVDAHKLAIFIRQAVRCIECYSKNSLYITGKVTDLMTFIEENASDLSKSSCRQTFPHASKSTLNSLIKNNRRKGLKGDQNAPDSIGSQTVLTHLNISCQKCSYKTFHQIYDDTTVKEFISLHVPDGSLPDLPTSKSENVTSALPKIQNAGNYTNERISEKPSDSRVQGAPFHRTSSNGGQLKSTEIWNREGTSSTHSSLANSCLGTATNSGVRRSSHLATLTSASDLNNHKILNNILTDASSAKSSDWIPPSPSAPGFSVNEKWDMTKMSLKSQDMNHFVTQMNVLTSAPESSVEKINEEEALMETENLNVDKRGGNSADTSDEPKSSGLKAAKKESKPESLRDKGINEYGKIEDECDIPEKLTHFNIAEQLAPIYPLLKNLKTIFRGNYREKMKRARRFGFNVRNRTRIILSRKKMLSSSHLQGFLRQLILLLGSQEAKVRPENDPENKIVDYPLVSKNTLSGELRRASVKPENCCRLTSDVDNKDSVMESVTFQQQSELNRSIILKIIRLLNGLQVSCAENNPRNGAKVRKGDEFGIQTESEAAPRQDSGFEINRAKSVTSDKCLPDARPISQSDGEEEEEEEEDCSINEKNLFKSQFESFPRQNGDQRPDALCRFHDLLSSDSEQD